MANSSETDLNKKRITETKTRESTNNTTSG